MSRQEYPIDRFWSELFDTVWASPTYGRFYDPEKFDLVPKRDYVEKEIARMEEDLKREEKAHEDRVKALREKISSLKGQYKTG